MTGRNKLYLDVCTLCRPFDNQDLMRIRLETDAYYLILQAVQSGNYEMIVSPVHLQEIDAIRDFQERCEISAILEKFGTKPKPDLTPIRRRAEYLCTIKVGVADAAHVAFSESTADFFISCDDKLLKCCARIGVEILAMNPVEFCMRENLR